MLGDRGKDRASPKDSFSEGVISWPKQSGEVGKIELAKPGLGLSGRTVVLRPRALVYPSSMNALRRRVAG